MTVLLGVVDNSFLLSYFNVDGTHTYFLLRKHYNFLFYCKETIGTYRTRKTIFVFPNQKIS